MQWEYTSAKVKGMAKAGADGWELVGVAGGVGYFKRPLSSRPAVETYVAETAIERAARKRAAVAVKVKEQKAQEVKDNASVSRQRRTVRR